MNAIEIGNKIAEGRKAIGLSQSALAERLSVSAQAVSKWERGESLPDIIMLNNIATIYGAELNYFSTDCPPTSQPTKRAHNMSLAEWREADFSNLTNLGEKFNHSNIVECQFNSADFSNTALKGNNITKCSFNAANLSGCTITGSNIVNSSFEGARLTSARINASNISKSNLNGADLSHSTIKQSSLTKTTLENAILVDTEFRGSSFTDTTFSTNLTDCQFINCGGKRLGFENVHFANTMFKNTKLSRASFHNCTADPISYAFLKSAKAPLADIKLLPQ